MPATGIRMPRVRKKEVVMNCRQEMTRILWETYYSTVGWPTGDLLCWHLQGQPRVSSPALLPALLAQLVHQEPSSLTFPAAITQHPCQTLPVLLPQKNSRWCSASPVSFVNIPLLNSFVKLTIHFVCKKQLWGTSFNRKLVEAGFDEGFLQALIGFKPY